MLFECFVGDDRGQLKRVSAFGNSSVPSSSSISSSFISEQKDNENFQFKFSIQLLENKKVSSTEIETENVSEEKEIQKVCQFHFQNRIFALIARKDTPQLQLVSMLGSTSTSSDSYGHLRKLVFASIQNNSKGTSDVNDTFSSSSSSFDYIGLSCTVIDDYLHAVSMDSAGKFSYYQIKREYLLSDSMSTLSDSHSCSSVIKPSVFLRSCIGSNIHAFRMQWNTNLIEESIFATGGANRPLEIWKLNSSSSNEFCSSIFKASKESRNELNMIMPLTINDLDFITPSNSQSSIIVIGTHQREIRIYDTRVGNKPIFHKTLSDFPIQRICCSPETKLIFFTDSRGNIYGLDERTQRLFGKYKDCVGSVTDILCLQSYLFVISLDRYIRIFDVSSKELLGKCYLTQRLSCFSQLTVKESQSKKRFDQDESEDEIDSENDISDADNNSDSDAKSDDAIWKKLAKVDSRKK